ncbi:MAG: sodium:solute symporter family protein [Pseudomonadota bacterium]
MAIQRGRRSDFIDNLGKIYLMYTGGFVAFIVLLGILEAVGVRDDILGFLFVGFTLVIYAAIGILSRTMRVSDYYVAGLQVPAFYNGMATAADWMSSASFLAMAGTLYVLGYDGLAFLIGWTGGYVLVAVLIAPYLRKFGAYSVPDFLAARYGGNFVRLLGIVVLLAASYLYAVAQIRGTGLIAERFLHIPYTYAVFVGMAGILFCSILGGMRAVTWTQVAQYIVLIIAYLTPVVIMSNSVTGVPVPQIMYGEALQQIAALEREMLASGLADAETLTPHLTPYTTTDPINFFALVLCLMVGTASLPHVLMRYFTTPSVRAARKSAGWSLLFIFILFFTAPAYAAFVKLEIYQSIIGQSFGNLPDWIYVWGGNEKVKICDAAARSLEAVTAACQAAGTDVVRLADFWIAEDVVVIATPEIAGLPFVITGLVGAGALAAALSTADGLLLAMSNALSHDVYYKMVDPNAPTGRRLVAARFILLGIAVAAAFTAVLAPPDILHLVAWAFSLAAAGNFPALLLGIWWDRCTSQGAIAGMIAGFGTTLGYLIYTGPAPFGFANEPIFGIATISAGIFGLPIGFAVTIAVSLMTPAPSEEMRQMIRAIRRPGGATVSRDGDLRPAE